MPGHQESGQPGLEQLGSGEQETGQQSGGQQGSQQPNGGVKVPETHQAPSGCEQGQQDPNQSEPAHQDSNHPELDQRDQNNHEESISVEPVRSEPPPLGRNTREPESQVERPVHTDQHQSNPDESTKICENSQNLTETQLKTLLSHLNMAQLVDIADKLPEFRSTIAYDFMLDKFRLHNRLIQLETGSPAISTSDAHSITIRGSELIKKLLKHVGDYITRLRIHIARFDELQAVAMYRAVNAHCWQLLKHIEFSGMFVNPFAGWHGEFPAVSSLAIDNVYGNIDDMQIPTIFPNLKTLRLHVFSTANLSFIGHKFPHLEHFILRAHPSIETNQHLRQFFVENSQLHTVDLDSFAKFEFLRVINEHLPHLKQLNLLSVSTDFFAAENCEHKLHFGATQEFSVRLTRDEHLNAQCIPFVLPVVRLIEVATSRLPEQWLDFIGQHEDVVAVSLPETELTRHELSRVTRNRPKIREIAVQWSEKPIDPTDRFKEYSTDPLIQFMAFGADLDQVTVWSDISTDSRSPFQKAGRRWKPTTREIVNNRSRITYVRQPVKGLWY